VLVATIATVGESQNFQVANQVVFVEHSWTQVHMDQARDRVYRNGQKQRVTVVDIVARATIDTQRILPKLAAKDALAKMILGG
jgi:SNF2 family DNA or RNA helicase